MANRIDVALRAHVETELGRGLSVFFGNIVLAVSLGATLPVFGFGDELKVTGTVIDADSKMPLSGAYVFASYRVTRFGLAGSGSWCVKTKGMYTGPDGKYEFPLESMDGDNPYLLSAIKPDYAGGLIHPKNGGPWRKQTPADYQDTIIPLRKQDPAKPDFHFGSGDEFCDRATTKEAGAAGTEFLRIEVEERSKYGWPEEKVEAMRKTIKERELSPSKKSPK